MRPEERNVQEHGRTDDRANLKEINRPPAAFGPEKFAARRLSLPKHGDFGVALKDINFSVRAARSSASRGSRATARTNSWKP